LTSMNVEKRSHPSALPKELCLSLLFQDRLLCSLKSLLLFLHGWALHFASSLCAVHLIFCSVMTHLKSIGASSSP
jgi:hypothetical protein